MRKRPKRTEEAFQMAPMIDMVFLLLVFFMTVSTLAKDARPEVELAVSTTAMVPEEAPPRDILTVIHTEPGFIWFWGNRRVNKEELEALLEESSNSDFPPEILLRGAPDLSWRAWKELLPLCRSMGVSDLVFSTFED